MKIKINKRNRDSKSFYNLSGLIGKSYYEVIELLYQLGLSKKYYDMDLWVLQNNVYERLGKYNSDSNIKIYLDGRLKSSKVILIYYEEKKG